jgi:hypothetical protein
MAVPVVAIVAVEELVDIVELVVINILRLALEEEVVPGREVAALLLVVVVEVLDY